MSNLVIANKSDLAAIANAIRTKAGISDSLSFPNGFVSGINGISGEGSGSESGGNSGSTVNYADQIYEYYGVDKGVYPYLYFRFHKNGSYLCFGKTITDDYKTITSGYYYVLGEKLTMDNSSDLLAVCSWLCTEVFKGREIQNITSSSYYMHIYDESGIIYYLNYDYQFSNSTFYSLNPTEETLPYDGLANGYDIMFYDENNEELAFYSIKEGHSINAPVYNCKNWQDADGAVITFPYTPTEDAIFYASDVTYADKLYEFYGIDKEAYPYVFIYYQSASRQIFLYFSDNCSISDGLVKLQGYYRGYKTGVSISTPKDLETVLMTCMNDIPSVALYPHNSDTLQNTNAYYYYSNCDDVLSGYSSAYHASLV